MDKQLQHEDFRKPSVEEHSSKKDSTLDAVSKLNKDIEEAKRQKYLAFLKEDQQLKAKNDAEKLKALEMMMKVLEHNVKTGKAKTKELMTAYENF